LPRLIFHTSAKGNLFHDKHDEDSPGGCGRCRRSGCSYPPIVVIPAGSRITIYGCLQNGSWCDISWGPNRGWMSSAYLQVTSNARRVPLRGFSGVPFITFNFGNYWDSHYKNRPFFNQKNKWSGFHWQNGNWDNNGPKNPPPKPPFPPKPPKGGNMGGPNDHQPPFGFPNKPPKFGNGQVGNGQHMGPPPGKNCKVINGQWVCKAP
jgi:hypothetical protein